MISVSAGAPLPAPGDGGMQTWKSLQVHPVGHSLDARHPGGAPGSPALSPPALVPHALQKVATTTISIARMRGAIATGVPRSPARSRRLGTREPARAGKTMTAMSRRPPAALHRRGALLSCTQVMELERAAALDLVRACAAGDAAAMRRFEALYFA